MQRKDGFTLIESMVALAVLSILATLAIPAFHATFQAARVRGAADAIVDLVAEARQGAVKIAREVSVASGGEGAQSCIGAREAPMPVAGAQSGAAAACDCLARSEECVVAGERRTVVGARFGGVAVTAASPHPLGFDGRIGMRIDAGRMDVFQVASGRHLLSVSVSPLGHASVCSLSGHVSGVPAC